jgi:hypothetical protein
LRRIPGRENYFLIARAALGFSCVGFLFFQLLLPTKDSRFVARFFGFGDHAFALVGAGDGGPCEDVVGVEREDAPGGFNGAVKILLGVIGLRQAMQCVAKFGIEFERARVFRDCFREFSFTERIYACVVMVFRAFGTLARHVVILAPVLPC